MSDKEWFDRNEQREGIRRAWDDFFAEWDILICPSYSMAAFGPHSRLQATFVAGLRFFTPTAACAVKIAAFGSAAR